MYKVGAVSVYPPRSLRDAFPPAYEHTKSFMVVNVKDKKVFITFNAETPENEDQQTYELYNSARLVDVQLAMRAIAHVLNLFLKRKKKGSFNISYNLISLFDV